MDPFVLVVGAGDLGFCIGAPTHVTYPGGDRGEVSGRSRTSDANPTAIFCHWNARESETASINFADGARSTRSYEGVGDGGFILVVVVRRDPWGPRGESSRGS